MTEKACLRTQPIRYLHLAIVILASGCATTFETISIEQVPLVERAQKQFKQNVQVTAAVLSAEECELIFGVDLYARGVQPVWLAIENNDESSMRFLPAGLDPEYFTPLEVSYVFRSRFAKEANQQKDKHFQNLAMGNRIGPGETRSGFVFSHLEHGTKIFNVDVIGQDNDLRTFTFTIPVPGFAVDDLETDWTEIYAPSEVMAYDRHDAKAALEKLPCCVTNQDGDKKGLPVNVVLVGTFDDVVYALIRGGWDATERTTSQQTISVAVAGTEDRYLSLSTRYAFGRPQDASFRKSRRDSEPHAHLRLWLSPITVDGDPVWIGEVGRDLPARFESSDRLVDADDARAMLFQDILLSQTLSFLGVVKRSNAMPAARSYEQLSDAPFVADAFRIVLGIDSGPVAVPDVEHLPWEKLPF